MVSIEFFENVRMHTDDETIGDVGLVHRLLWQSDVTLFILRILCISPTQVMSSLMFQKHLWGVLSIHMHAFFSMKGNAYLYHCQISPSDCNIQLMLWQNESFGGYLDQLHGLRHVLYTHFVIYAKVEKR